jgi:hypothetical protein
MPRLDRWPTSIREINDLPREQKRAIYQTLIPDWVYSRFGINPADDAVQGTDMICVRSPAGSNSVEISVFGTPGADEPALYLHMGDTFNSQLVVLLVVVNDPSSPRFNIDVDEQGHSTLLGTRSRNLSEEVRAMKAGLVPGQVRRGMRIFRSTLPVFERFVSNIGHDLFLIEPLFYHNAIAFERYGFAYAQGLRKMRKIHHEFLPGSSLHAGLDGSTPFRSPDAWETISGRSWAIQDGILGEPFGGIQMYKRVGKSAGVRTFPDAKW